MITIGPLQFDFSNPWLVVLTALLFVSLLFSMRTVSGRLLHRSPLRVLAVLVLNGVAYGVVFLLLLEPRISHPGAKSVILVTEGAVPVQDRMTDMARLYVAPRVATTNETRRTLATADWLLDIGQLRLREPALSAIEVRGYGLDQDQWQNFSNNIVIDFKPPAIDGFTAMRWQRFLHEGDTLRISGHYSQAGSDGVVQLRLLDPAANTAAETRVKNGQNFSLAARVKTRGILEYRLQAWSADILQSEQTVAFEAGTGSRLNIMVKQSAPSFETRQLKDFAAANGHAVRINSDISKGKFISQSVNLPADTDTALSPRILAEQDLLIMDGRAFVDLPLTRRQWLNDAVENGLGLLVLADSALLEQFGELGTSLLDGFSLTPLTGTETTVIPRLQTGGPADWQEPVSTAAMLLRADDADVLIDSTDGRNLLIKRSTGLGQVGISLIRHSHNWLTAGHRAQWSDYWAALLGALARQRGGSFILPQAETDFYRVNRRTAVCAFSSSQDTSVVVSAVGARGQPTVLELQPAPDTLNSPRQCAYFWPQAGGWHRVELLPASGDSVLDQKTVYVFGADQWLAQQRDNRVTATRARAANSETAPPATAENRVSEPLSLFWLWLTLVMSATFLWLERKLDFG